MLTELFLLPLQARLSDLMYKVGFCGRCDMTSMGACHVGHLLLLCQCVASGITSNMCRCRLQRRSSKTRLPARTLSQRSWTSSMTRSRSPSGIWRRTTGDRACPDVGDGRVVLLTCACKLLIQAHSLSASEVPWTLHGAHKPAASDRLYNSTQSSATSCVTRWRINAGCQVCRLGQIQSETTVHGLMEDIEKLQWHMMCSTTLAADTTWSPSDATPRLRSEVLQEVLSHGTQPQ